MIDAAIPPPGQPPPPDTLAGSAAQPSQQPTPPTAPLDPATETLGLAKAQFSESKKQTGLARLSTWIAALGAAVSSIVAIASLCVSVQALTVSDQALTVSKQALGLTETQIAITKALEQTRLTLVELEPVARPQRHNSPAVYAPRLHLAHGLVKGEFLSQTTCSGVMLNGQEPYTNTTTTQSTIESTTDKLGAECEYQLAVASFSGDYLLTRKVYGKVAYSDTLERKYEFRWCRKWVRESEIIFQPNPKLVPCGPDETVLLSPESETSPPK